jgi:hypothetical protein
VAPPSENADPKLTVRMYNFAPMRPSVLASAAALANVALHGSGIRLGWVDCTSAPRSASCEWPDRPDLLTIRILPRALPQASAGALGTAMRSVRGDSAALFYDRAATLSRPGLYLDQILGRAMAHEIIHMLLPDGSHSDFGLMRGEWVSEDLRLGNPACFGLTKQTVELIRREALRRVLAGVSQQSTKW